MPDLTSRLELALPPRRSGRDLALAVDPGDLRRVAERMLRRGWFLEDVCGLDLAEGLAVLYHFSHWERPGRVALRVMLPGDAPACPSIEDIYPGSAWHERETRDFFGIEFTGQENDSPLLLDKPMDPPPLRKQTRERVSSHVLWPHAEWVGQAGGLRVAEELMAASGPDHQSSDRGEAAP